MKKIIALVIIIGCVWLMYKYPYTMLNPGELVEGHMEIEKDCFSCHNPFWGVPSKKCIECHDLSEIGKVSITTNDSTSFNNKISFHQSLKKQECTSCHTDHIGVNPDMPISQFSHDILSQTNKINCTSCHNQPQDKLHNKLTLDCNNCHNTIDWNSTELFDHDFIKGSLQNNCSSCHQNPSDLFHKQNTKNCNQCHTTTKWIPSTFNHKKYFRFDKHHKDNCKNCHTTNNYAKYTCYNCHKHSLNKIKKEHYEEGIYQFENCTECHKSGNEDEAERMWKSKKRYNSSGKKQRKKKNHRHHKKERYDDDD